MNKLKRIEMKKLITLILVLLLTSSIFGQGSEQGICQGTWANIKDESEHISKFYLNSCSKVGRQSVDTARINNFVNNFYDVSVCGLRLSTYSFVNDKKLYMLSYDREITFVYYDDNGNELKSTVSYNPDNSNDFFNMGHSHLKWYAERNFRLYCWSDNKWTPASEPIQNFPDVWLREIENFNVWVYAETYFPRMFGENQKYLGDMTKTYVKDLGNGEIEMKVTYSIIGNIYHDVPSRFFYKILKFTPNGDGTYEINLISTTR